MRRLSPQPLEYNKPKRKFVCAIVVWDCVLYFLSELY